MISLRLSLEACRVNANLTQEEVAKKVGKSRQTVQLWEAGKVKIDRANLDLLSQIYNSPIDNIFLPY